MAVLNKFCQLHLYIFVSFKTVFLFKLAQKVKIKNYNQSENKMLSHSLV